FIGVSAAIVAMGLCLTLSSFLNLRMINKVSGSKIIIRNQLIKILLISIPVASLVSFLTNLLNHFVPLFFNLAISCSLGAFFFLALCHMFNIMDIKIWILNILKKKKPSRRLSKQKLRV
ncbi:MAG: hypothetical protein PHC47_02910, partial [Clostridia bacterium]|nr:hypothetical protein [Clostridia bacterium]